MILLDFDDAKDPYYSYHEFIHEDWYRHSLYFLQFNSYFHPSSRHSIYLHHFVTKYIHCIYYYRNCLINQTSHHQIANHSSILATFSADDTLSGNSFFPY